MISIKNKKELEIMEDCGKITAAVMKKVLQSAKPGITKAALDKIATFEIKKLGGELSFTTVAGYNWATCITVDSEVVHGIPNDYILRQNDLVSVDLGVRLRGFHTDMARTIFLGNLPDDVEKFLNTGKRALEKAIDKAEVGNRINLISETIQGIIEGAGYSIVRELVGHGIGKNLHEEPDVPGYETTQKGPELKEGMTIAIEIIYIKGNPNVFLQDDGWTISAKDGSLSGLFEDTVAITKSGPVILTKIN